MSKNSVSTAHHKNPVALSTISSTDAAFGVAYPRQPFELNTNFLAIHLFKTAQRGFKSISVIICCSLRRTCKFINLISNEFNPSFRMLYISMKSSASPLKPQPKYLNVCLAELTIKDVALSHCENDISQLVPLALHLKLNF